MARPKGVEPLTARFVGGFIFVLIHSIVFKNPLLSLLLNN